MMHYYEVLHVPASSLSNIGIIQMSQMDCSLEKEGYLVIVTETQFLNFYNSSSTALKLREAELQGLTFKWLFNYLPFILHFLQLLQFNSAYSH